MAAAIEAPLTFFQEAVKAVFGDAVEAAQMALGLVPEILDAVDVMPARADKCFAVVHAAVMKLGDIQHIVSPEAVGINDAVGHNFLTYDRDQG